MRLQFVQSTICGNSVKGYTAQNISSVLHGLIGQPIVIKCTQAEIQGWTKILEFKSDIFTSLSLTWSISCGNMIELGLDKLFEQINKCKMSSIIMELNFGSKEFNNNDFESGDQLREIWK